MVNKAHQLSELWKHVCAGEQEAYALLHYELYPGLFAYTRSILKDEDMTNDLVQDLFVKLWVKKGSIGHIENVKAYFYRAARSLSINLLRSLKTQQSRLGNFSSDEIQFSMEDLIIAEEQNVSLKKAVHEALNKLPSKQREIIHLSFFESLNYNQIADITGIKYQSVVNHVYRAVQLLRAEFKVSDNVVAA